MSWRFTKSAEAPLEEVLAIKQKADAGNVQAQITLGEKLAANHRPADALAWYRKAAAKGSVEADFRIGDMLLHGASAAGADQCIRVNAAEGVRRTFSAATNLHPRACRNMSQAFQHGLAVKTNLVEAYAWLFLSAERNASAGRVELSSLALRMETRDIQEGQKLVKQFKNRHWPDLVLNKTVAITPGLRLDGITTGGSALAVINRRTLEAGESASIPVKGGTLVVKCLKIAEDSVLIEVAGEDAPRWLRFEGNLAAREGR